MNLGTENRNKVIAAAALGAIAVIVLLAQFSGWLGGSSSSASASQPTLSTSADSAMSRAANRARTPATKSTLAQTMDPSLRYDLLKASEDTRYEGTGRNIFRVFVEPPPPPPRPVAPVATDQPPAQTAYVPPPPPPIELKFYGFATPAGGTKRIFLAHNEDVFIAKEGDIVNRRYKVVHIAPNSVDILDVLSNNRQTIPLIQG